MLGEVTLDFDLVSGYLEFAGGFGQFTAIDEFEFVMHVVEQTEEELVCVFLRLSAEGWIFDTEVLLELVRRD